MNTSGENLIQKDIEQEMKDAYLDYSMSVIASRALPDVRDGLKPVHRRILYTMYGNGLYPEREFRKCADTVGNVLEMCIRDRWCTAAILHSLFSGFRCVWLLMFPSLIFLFLALSIKTSKKFICNLFRITRSKQLKALEIPLFFMLKYCV